MRPAVQDGWDSYPDRIALLRQPAKLESINPEPIEAIRPALEKSAENSPDDDQIWLGRANLTIRTGQFAAGKRCRRPRLVAVQSGDPERERRAL